MLRRAAARARPPGGRACLFSGTRRAGARALHPGRRAARASARRAARWYAGASSAARVALLACPRCPSRWSAAANGRVQLVREEGRDVSS